MEDTSPFETAESNSPGCPNAESPNAEGHRPFALTDLQQAYWLGQDGFFELGSLRAHMYTEMEFADLELDRLERAIQRLVDRHDMLRAVVTAHGQQQVLENVPAYRIDARDLRTCDPGELDAILSEVRARMSHQGPNPQAWPLFELRVHRLPADRCRVHVNMSLLILDAHSLKLLAEEVGRLYLDPAAPLHGLSATYRDYVGALEARKGSEAYRRSHEYWWRRIPTLPPAPALPVVRDASRLLELRFGRRSSRLEAPSWSQLKVLAARAKLTPSALLCAAYADVLAAWSAEPAFTLNVMSSNRLPFHGQVGELFGNFSATSLLEVDGVGATFEARARRMQSQLLKDLRYGAMSGVEVLREWNRAHGGTSRAAMPVVFASTLDSPAPWFAYAVHGALETPQVWLDHQVYEQGGTLFLQWDAVEELFPEGLLDDMFDAYTSLLDRLASGDESAWRGSVRSAVPARQLAMQSAVNATEAPIPAGMLHTLFVAQAIRAPDRQAIATTERVMTYEELRRHSNRIGHLLREHGARPNELVAVVAEKGWEAIVGILGVLQSGAAYLPLDPALPKERLWHLLELGEVKRVVTHARLDGHMEWPRSVDVFRVDGPELESVDEDDLPAAQREDDLAYVIFTSGSTGEPKGVMIDHRAVVNTIADINARFGVGPRDKVLALSSWSFDLSVYDLFGPLMVGGTIVLPASHASHSARNPAPWVEMMMREGVTVWNSVPALMQLLLEYVAGRNEVLPATLRLVLLSGDWIPLSLPDEIRALAPDADVISLGGATEASIWSILHPIRAIHTDWVSIPYGRPMANQRFHVLDSNLEPRPMWVPGELCIGGIGLAKGYWRDAERTNAQFFHHPRTHERLYRTGDYGRWLPDGQIEFLGRRDSQVKVQGYRIELGEIEATLERHPAVQRAAIVAHGESTGTKRLVAFVVAHAEHEPDEGELREHAERTLPAYMVPSSFIFVDAFPLSSNGKVDRKRLPRPDTRNGPLARTHVPPSDALQRELTRIWQSVLDVRPIGATDHFFFDLGGNSLLAVRLITHLRTELGQELPLSALFQRPTVAELAEYLRTSSATENQGTRAEPTP